MPIVRIENKGRDLAVVADAVIPSGQSIVVDWPASKIEQNGPTLQTLQDLGLIQYTVGYNAATSEDIEIAMLSFATGGGGGGVPTSRQINTIAPLGGGGDLSANRTFTISPATPSDPGSMSAADKLKLDSFPVSAVPTSRILLAGAGLSGGGDLTANRMFDVGANPDGSITVNADNIQVGILATDAQHGNRGGGGLHADATTTVSGFMSPADKTKLDTFPSSAVPDTRLLTAGAGLTGGGDLSANRTFDVVANADGSITVNANDVQVGILATDAQHGSRGGGTQHADATIAVAGFMSATDKTKLDGLPSSAPPTTLTLTAGAGLTGGGDLSANRTFNVAANADGSITVNADDIQVGILATDAQHGSRGGGTLHATATTATQGFIALATQLEVNAGVVTDKAVTPATLAPLLAGPHYGFGTVDFGDAVNGTAYTTTVVTGETAILVGSSVRAWVYPKDTADHSIDEHMVDGPIVSAGSIVAGTGFTIYAVSGSSQGNLWGLWSVAWSYNI